MSKTLPKLLRFIAGVMCDHKHGQTIYPALDSKSDCGYACIRCDGCADILASWKSKSGSSGDGFGPTREQLSRPGILRGMQVKLNKGTRESRFRSDRRERMGNKLDKAIDNVWSILQKADKRIGG